MLLPPPPSLPSPYRQQGREKTFDVAKSPPPPFSPFFTALNPSLSFFPVSSFPCSNNPPALKMETRESSTRFSPLYCFRKKSANYIEARQNSNYKKRKVSYGIPKVQFFDLIAWLNYWNVGDFLFSRSQKNGDSSKNFFPPCVGPTETKRGKEWEERADLSAKSLLLPPVSELRAGGERKFGIQRVFMRNLRKPACQCGCRPNWSNFGAG